MSRERVGTWCVFTLVTTHHLLLGGARGRCDVKVSCDERSEREMCTHRRREGRGAESVVLEILGLLEIRMVSSSHPLPKDAARYYVLS